MPTISYDTEPEFRRNLVARNAVFHRIRHYIGDLCGTLQSTPQGKLRDDLILAANAMPEDFTDDRSAADWLAREWAASLRQVEQRRVGLGAPSQYVHTTVVELQAAVSATSGDDERVLDLFLDAICRSAEAIYLCPRKRAYEPAGGSVGRGGVPAPRAPEWVDPAVELARVNKHPGRNRHAESQNPDVYAVTATTVRRETGRPLVTVKAFLDEFGPETFAAMPRLMAHEVVCHVPSRHDSDGSSSFAEGMMDWVAAYFLTPLMEDIDPVFWEAAARHHGDRFSDALVTRDAAGFKAASGRKAARWLLGWFVKRLRLPSSEAPAQVANLALAVNLVHRDLVEKDRFVALLPDPLPAVLEDGLTRWANETISAASLLDLAEEVAP